QVVDRPDHQQIALLQPAGRTNPPGAIPQMALELTDDRLFGEDHERPLTTRIEAVDGMDERQPSHLDKVLSRLPARRERPSEAHGEAVVVVDQLTSEPGIPRAGEELVELAERLGCPGSRCPTGGKVVIEACRIRHHRCRGSRQVGVPRAGSGATPLDRVRGPGTSVKWSKGYQAGRRGRPAPRRDLLEQGAAGCQMVRADSVAQKE